MPEVWKRLDLRSKQSMPPLNALTALCLRPPKNRSALYWSERYEVGRFQTEERQRKVWWHGSSGVRDPVKMRKHYDIWWYPLPEFRDD